MTNTTSQYYFARADLRSPADNPHVNVFTPRTLSAAPFLSHILHPHPKLQLLRQPKPLPEEIGHFLGFFQTLFFQVGLLVSLERCSERDSGGQPGREGRFVGARRGAGTCRTHPSPDTGREKQQSPGQQMNSAFHFCDFAVNPRSVNWFL